LSDRLADVLANAILLAQKDRIDRNSGRVVAGRRRGSDGHLIFAVVYLFHIEPVTQFEAIKWLMTGNLGRDTETAMTMKLALPTARVLYPELGDEPVDRIDHETLILAERRARVTRLYARGKTMRQIAGEVGTSAATVCRDVGHVLESLVQAGMQEMEVKRASMLAKLKMREAALWEAFERSQGESTETSTSRRNTGGGSFDQVGIKRRQRDGDPRWMRLLEGVWEQEARLHGVVTKENTDADGPVPVKLVAGVNPLELV
jgi:hypothetical protein